MDTSVYLLSYEWTAGKNDNTQNCLFVSLFAFYCVKEKIKKKSSRSCPCLLGCFHSALS